ncbi:MAG: protein phosphatase 2C domain-containing protein [Leptolyngbyaceae bacterium]|nr:protein phosphatase 2C domain-containing protein [Leptolyngbyaceae bacterium]
MIQCPNHTCQASNAETDRFCHRCRAPLPRRLLWAVGYQADTFTPGEVISGRYRCKASRIFLDQQPGIPPGTLVDVPKTVLPYLHLISHQIHLPQVYGWVDAELKSGEVTRLLLLENAALLSLVAAPTQIYPVDPSRNTQPDPLPKHSPCLLPSLHRAWPHASAAQQLHWLWQLARLWPPLASEQVAATLLKAHLIRVEGPLIRILELRFGLNPTTLTSRSPGESPSAISVPTLVQLGVFWLDLMTQAAPAIQDFGQALCQHMIEGRLADPMVLQDILGDAIDQIGRSQTLRIGIATQTDKGPSRGANEDACFPAEGSVMGLEDILNSQEDGGLVIVCDGIGGHQGGAIASDLAIKTIAQQVRQSTHRLAKIAAIQADLKQAIAQANDVISQTNDDNQRRDRQRMGTTVVMGLLHGRDCYITHVGDSRAYWVTQWGCHQLTLDDDVVSRETRLGYGTYRSILYQPNSGALVQALGMSASKNLYPTVQRLILEGEGLLLLCSDGLSDQDLIESCWEAVLRPVLLGEASDLGTVSQQLVDLANTHNGHDNVTVGLIHWQVRQTAPAPLAGVIDLSAFITQDGEATAARTPSSQRPGTARRRPITDLSPLPDSQEMGGISGVAPTPSDRPRTANPGTVMRTRGSSPSTAMTNPQVAAEGLPPDPNPNADSNRADVSTPAIGLQRLNLETGPTAAPDGTRADAGVEQAAAPPPSILVRVMVVAGAIASLGMVSLLAYVWVPSISDRVHAILGIESPRRSPDTDDDGRDESNGTIDNSSLSVGRVVQIQAFPPATSADSDSSPDLASQSPLQLLALDSAPDYSDPTLFPSSSVPQAEVLGTIPWGSILVVRGSFEVPDPNSDLSSNLESQQGGANTLADDRATDGSSANGDLTVSDGSSATSGERVMLMAGRWLEVQLCMVPTSASPSTPTADLAAGTVGWVPESLLRSVVQNQSAPSTARELCPLPPNRSQE